ncbi:EMI1 family protein [Acetobacter pasteurianus]|uniref:Early meiotic induction protein 1 n=1 Tax=Lodderomyces elongisporus (strain ATCC 11503 / CBS 2605 / JCM 1781 / NBRC 1676 / NRRL YB-4239) TaxID=379508 RepID=A5DUD4_LODEL|nr:uncharacterized protein PVL30_000933 [Lodderomyces elongisporus]EDK42792.1 conserved hypothetical protein [Lodderomyces elongisporus NRRL YB-4239]MDC6271736.1 EMI1 family protein [Acetobacter pasteurianus]WLF77223.1 hypothetical protein PVL30_000933 [Lodderomyces elongisporus]
MTTNGDKELNEIWKSLQESDSSLDLKRKEVLTSIQQNTELNDFPHKLAIMTALDELIGCFALGGQFKNYYRYGSYDSCQRQREKFWFAMKHGSMFESGGQEKPIEELSEKELNSRIKIQEFYKKRLLEDKAKGSSEDIWDARKELVDYPFR